MIMAGTLGGWRVYGFHELRTVNYEFAHDDFGCFSVDGACYYQCASYRRNTF